MTHILLSRGILGQSHIVRYLAPFIKSTDKVAIVAFSFFPHHAPTKKAYDALYLKGGVYYQKMVDAFSPYGILEDHITFLNYYHDDIQTMTTHLNQADIIYFPGGAPDLMMERLHEKALVPVIQNQKNKVMIGSSAGSMIQFETFHISPDHDYHKFEQRTGLGFLTGFGIEVHYRRRRKQKAALRKVHRAYKIPLYAIPDDGLLLIHNHQISCIGAYMLYDEKGIV